MQTFLLKMLPMKQNLPDRRNKTGFQRINRRRERRKRKISSLPKANRERLAEREESDNYV